MSAPTKRFHKPAPISGGDRLRRAAFFLLWLACVGVLIALFRHETRSLTANGVVDGARLPLAFVGTGRIVRLDATVGATVAAGTVIAELDRADLDTQLALLRKRRQALVDGHRAQLAAIEAESSLVLQQIEKERRETLRDIERDRRLIAESAAELRVVEAELKAATTRLAQGYSREEDLTSLRLRQGILSGRLATVERPQSLASLVSAPAAVEGDAAADVFALERQRQIELAARLGEEASGEHQAALLEIDEQIAVVEREAGSMVVSSPVDGVVAQIHFPVGSVVPAGMPVATLVRSDSLRIVAYVPERFARLVRADSQVQVMPLGMGRPAVAGRVLNRAPAIDFLPTEWQPGNAQVQRALAVVVEVAAGDLIPGERVELRFGDQRWWAVLSW